MKKLVGLVLFLLLSTTINGQTLKDENVSLTFDTENNRYLVIFDNIKNDRKDVQITIECFSTIIDYKNVKHITKLSTIKQNISGVGTYIFGGELLEGDYVITLEYTKNNKSVKKIQKKQYYL